MGHRDARAGRPRRDDRHPRPRQAARSKPRAHSARGRADHRQGGHRRYERISYAYADRARISDYLAGKTDPAQSAASGAVGELAQKIVGLIDKTPLYYTELADKFSDYDFQTVARALGSLHAEQKLWQDAKGRICARGSPFAAKP